MKTANHKDTFILFDVDNSWTLGSNYLIRNAVSDIVRFVFGVHATDSSGFVLILENSV